MKQPTTLAEAQGGDIKAFQVLFAGNQEKLRSYLYRITANREDADDLVQDTFVRGFDRIKTFREEASLKTWLFRIATNLAIDLMRHRKRWPEDAQDRSKQLAMGSESIASEFMTTHLKAERGRYDVREHIDFCFTCIAKVLPIDQQVAVILKDIYDFKRQEISEILDRSEGKVKHLLFNGRKSLSQVFYKRCALVNQNGTCHQCSELAGIYNPRQARHQHLRKLELVAAAEQTNDQRKLYKVRKELVRFLDPLNSPGSDLQEVIMRCTRAAVGEISEEEVKAVSN